MISASSLAGAVDAQSGELPLFSSVSGRHSLCRRGRGLLSSPSAELWGPGPGLGWGEREAGPHRAGAPRCPFVSALLPACLMG